MPEPRWCVGSSFAGDNTGHLSMVNATMVRMLVFMMASLTTFLASHASSPNGHGYWCHITYSSPGSTATVWHKLALLCSSN